MLWIVVVCVAVGAYLLGSIPSGYLVGRARGVDLRKEGSCNIGATNALRVLGKKLGYLVFAADLIKGWLAVVLAMVITSIWMPEHSLTMGILAAGFVMVGHVFPVWLGFKGGKGIATAGGVMLGLFPIWVFIFGLAVWAVLFFATRYVSVASIGAAVSLPVSSGLLMIFFNQCEIRQVIIAGLMCVLAVWRHKGNIERLRNGTEKRFEKKRAQPQA